MPLSYANECIPLSPIKLQLPHHVPNCSLQLVDKNSKWISHLLRKRVDQKLLQTPPILQSKSTGNACIFLWLVSNVPLYTAAPRNSTCCRACAGGHQNGVVRQCVFYIKTRMDRSSTPTTQPTSCPLTFPSLWSPQRCHPWEKVWKWWQGYWRREQVTENITFKLIQQGVSRSQWPRGLRRGSAAARLLRLWVRIPPVAWMFVVSVVLSSRGLCDELITRPEESYRLWCVVVCDLETSGMRGGILSY